MLAALSIYFVIGALIADRFNTHYRKRWGIPCLALHWVDVMVAWPAYLVGWHLQGKP